MSTPNSSLYWLTQVNYQAHKQSIIVEFENSENKIVKKYAFFPFFDLMASQETVKPIVKELFSSISGSKYRLKFEEHSVKVLAKDFSELQKLHSLLVSSMDLQPVLLKPEQQFLCMQNWSYFDSFVFELGDLIKLGLTDFPSFLDTNTEPEKVLPLLVQNHLLLEKFSQTLSGLDILDKFLDIVEFKYFSDFEFTKLMAVNSNSVYAFEKFNLSKQTLNCFCCKPKSIQDSNCLPSSLIEAEFLQDGFFFDSGNRTFALQFHLNQHNLFSRIQRKKEFGLTQYPVGPFYRNQNAMIPWADALRLVQSHEIVLNWSQFQPSWFCLIQKSPLVLGLEKLHADQQTFTQSVETLQVQGLQKNGLKTYLKQNQSLAFQGFQAYRNLINQLLAGFPSYLSHPSSHSFSAGLQQQLRLLDGFS